MPRNVGVKVEPGFPALTDENVTVGAVVSMTIARLAPRLFVVPGAASVRVASFPA